MNLPLHAYNQYWISLLELRGYMVGLNIDRPVLEYAPSIHKILSLLAPAMGRGWAFSAAASDPLQLPLSLPVALYNY